MKNRPNVRVARKVFRQKRDRRQTLAALPFEKKIALLVRLQRMASEVNTVVRGTARQPWHIAED
jgi:hypothetical protein